PTTAEAAWGCLPVSLARRLEPSPCPNLELSPTDADRGHLSTRLSRCRTDLPGNAFLQRPRRGGVAFAPFAKGMTARIGPTARICYAELPPITSLKTGSG